MKKTKLYNFYIKFRPVVIAIAIAQATGIIGSIFTEDSVRNWYDFLLKPTFTPPDFIFQPVWIILYTMMGIASYLVWQKRSSTTAKAALWIYGIHLVFNALWSIIFFGMYNPGFAFLEIIVLIMFIITTTIFFWCVRPLAGLLLLPYLAWTIFAMILNYTIWQLN